MCGVVGSSHHTVALLLRILLEFILKYTSFVYTLIPLPPAPSTATWRSRVALWPLRLRASSMASCCQMRPVSAVPASCCGFVLCKSCLHYAYLLGTVKSFLPCGTLQATTAKMFQFRVVQPTS
jgi:hypothetical protein